MTEWETDGQAMCNLTPWLVAPSLACAVLQFQILRVLFVLFPYQVLALGENLAYTLALSVPGITWTAQFIILWWTGTLCDIESTRIYLYKLNIFPDIEKLEEMI